MEPQSLAAAQGWEWIKKGFALFKKAPLLWVVLLMIFMAGAVALSSIPVVGEPLLSLLMPVIVIGMMTGCRALENNEELELAHLFSGFQRQTTHLITLGGIALVGQYLIFGLMMLVGGAELVGILMSAKPDADPNILIQAAAAAGFALLLGAVLFSVLMMALQFAPMLVFFNNVPPQQAMKLSLRAFLNNIGPMLVYATTFMLLAILASLPMMLGWLVLLPLVFTSLYASFCDIFPPVKIADNPPPQNIFGGSDEQTRF
ncbi:MAG: BPSS1780 family membrane protein [Gallionella sp.]|nr:BPSS1780 family membrane protein [Gallionella sp.]